MAVCYHFATERLFRGFYGTADRGVNLLGSIRLHSRHDMAVRVEGDADRRMPEAFAGNLGITTINPYEIDSVWRANLGASFRYRF